MKNQNWLTKIHQSITVKPSRKHRRRRKAKTGLQFEALEAKNLLATVSFDASAELLVFQADAGEVDIVSVSAASADTLQIQVGSGDQIVLGGDAVGNSGFSLSQTATANDTLLVDVGSTAVSEFVANLGDLDDTFSVTGLAGIDSLFVIGSGGNDVIDASALNVGVALSGGSGNDTLTGGSGNDALNGGGGTDVISGGLGVDTNSFQGIAFGVTATVTANGTGSASYGTVDETFTGIENLTGSENNDVLTATGVAANILRGEGGNDVLAGGGGTDVIDGGLGNDTNSFQGIGFGVTATVAADGTGTASYGSVNESFAGIENLTGSENDDVLTATGAAANVLRGEGGDDVLAGGGGTDVIDGGLGNDTNSFQGIGFGVTASINNDGTGVAAYGPVNETFSGIENLIGSDNADNLTGNDLNNQIEGGLGDDVISGGAGDDVLAGGGGTDTIDGGLGNDTNSFQGIGFGVTASINNDGTGVAAYGPVNETFSGIENLIGSDNADNLTGNDLNNQIDGGLGNDVLSGGDGDDVLAGGGGTDVIDGGLGNDTNSFQGIGFGVTATVADDGTGTASYAIVEESFTGIENLTGSENDDVLTATGAVANVLRGEGGDDVLAGGGGTDVIDGGLGNDTNSFQGIGFEVTASINNDGTGVAAYGPVNETFSGIENLIGSDNADNLTGNNLVNQIDGGFGDDVISGLGGDDVLLGGSGSDTIDGGDGNDSLFGGTEDPLAATQTGFSVQLSGQPLVSLTTSQTSAELVAEAVNNNLYINVHTNDFPGGEIRGQLLLQSDVTVDGVRTLTLAGSLDAAQEPDNASDSSATGEGTVVITIDGSSVTYDSTLSIDGILVSDLLPVAGVSAIHIHNAPAGVNGPVITDIVQGAGGDINGIAVDPSFDTGDGNVFVEAIESDDDILRGGDGDDVIVGGIGDDTLNGGSGNDELSGNSGDDFFVGIGGTDVIDGGAGIDINSFQGIGFGVTATVNADGSGTASYGLVNESFTGIENLIGSDNADVLTVVGSNDTVLIGLGGDDILTGGGGNDQLVGNDGDDILRGQGGDDTAIGGDGNDSLNGGGGNDNLLGQDGDDFFVGIGGVDSINGGAGFDINSFQGIGFSVNAQIDDSGSGTAVYGQVNETFVGIESLIGSSNDDILVATGDVSRTLIGLDGDDLIIGGFGDDVLVGGQGNDTIVGRGGNDTLAGNQGNDQLNGDDGDDLAIGGEGDDNISGGLGLDSLFGGEGDDEIFGNDGDDFIFGGLGLDSLFGGDGDDELLGGDDDDLLNGGLGTDLLSGGLGTDQEIQ